MGEEDGGLYPFRGVDDPSDPTRSIQCREDDLVRTQHGTGNPAGAMNLSGGVDMFMLS